MIVASATLDKCIPLSTVDFSAQRFISGLALFDTPKLDEVMNSPPSPFRRAIMNDQTNDQ
jgi:hypothetical protein